MEEVLNLHRHAALCSYIGGEFPDRVYEDILPLTLNVFTSGWTGGRHLQEQAPSESSLFPSIQPSFFSMITS